MEDVGWWSWSRANGPTIVQKESQHRALGLESRDFGGRELTVTMINFWPIITAAKGPDGSLQPKSGYNVNLINTFADKLNLT